MSKYCLIIWCDVGVYELKFIVFYFGIVFGNIRVVVV